ncbi:MAG: Rieske (2Fe-2S) protein [Acidobacteriota bacterium]|nr:Rieske (2Fe-2S) protein [Acidobacteriota bacterium]
MTGRVCAGPLEALAGDRLNPIADGRAVAVRRGRAVLAYANVCPHTGSPVAGGLVRDGVAVCPQHFWRFEATTGRCIGPSGGLHPLPVTVVDGQVWVELDDPAPPVGWRQRLLARARDYDRASDYAVRMAGPDRQPPHPNGAGHQHLPTAAPPPPTAVASTESG